MRKPRILMLNPFYLPYQGGTEKHLHEVCTRLVKRGYKVGIATARLANTPEHERMDGVEVHRSKAWVLERLPAPLPPPVPVSLTMTQDIERLAKDYDVVHLHNRFFYHFLDLKRLKQRTGVKVGMTLHNARPQGISLSTDLLGSLYDDTLGKRIMKEADRIAGVSQNTIDITVPPQYLSKCQVIYNGVDVEMFNPKVKGDETRELLGLNGSFVIMTNVRLVPQKGVKYLLRAVALLAKSHPKVKLIVFGRGPLEEKLKSEAESLGIANNVIFFTNRLPDEGLARLYAACDAFVLPSVWEPFGMVLAEAMAVGKPVIGCSIGGIPEIVTPECGFVVPPRDPEAMADKLFKLASDPRLCKRMGVAGRRRAESTFTWDQTAKGYVDFYDKLFG